MECVDVSVSINVQGTRKSFAVREFLRSDEREILMAGQMTT